MKARKREQCVAQRRRPAECRPRDAPLVRSCFGPVALQRDAPPVQTQGDSRADVREQRERDDERLGQRGLVVGPCQQQVAVCVGHGADGERDERGVGDVEGGEDAEGVGAVFVDARHWDD